MRRIRHDIEQANQAHHGRETVFIRFPNNSKPLSGCIAGEVVYVFVNGDTAVCPYLAFAVENVNSKHSLSEFIAANLFRDADFSARLDAYDIYKRYGIPSNPSCSSCGIRGTCGNGCPAAVVAGGGRIGDTDRGGMSDEGSVVSLFVTVDGPNGVGKTTFVEVLTARLRDAGADVLSIREPSNSELGKFPA